MEVAAGGLRSVQDDFFSDGSVPGVVGKIILDRALSINLPLEI